MNQLKFNYPSYRYESNKFSKLYRRLQLQKSVDLDEMLSSTLQHQLDPRPLQIQL